MDLVPHLGTRSVSPTIRTSVIRRRSYPARVESLSVSDLRTSSASGSRRSRTSSAASPCLSGDQRVTMPPPGRRPAPRRSPRSAASRTIDSATTNRLAPRAPATARGVARVRLGRRQPHPGHPPGLGEGAARPLRPSHGASFAPPPPGISMWVEARRNDDFAALPVLERNLELEEALRRVLRVGRLAVHRAPRRLRALHEDDRGRRDLRRRQARARDCPRGPGRRRVNRRAVRGAPPARVRSARRRDRVHGRRLADRPDRPSILHLVLHPRRAADDALRRDRAALAVVDAARGRARPVRARDLAHARADAARDSAIPGAERVAEPHVGEPRRPQPAVLDWYEPLQATLLLPDQLGTVGLDDFVAAINRAEPG